MIIEMLALPTLYIFFYPESVCVQWPHAVKRFNFQATRTRSYDASRDHLHVAVALSSTTDGENNGSAIQWPAQRLLLQRWDFYVHYCIKDTGELHAVYSKL